MPAITTFCHVYTFQAIPFLSPFCSFTFLPVTWYHSRKWEFLCRFAGSGGIHTFSGVGTNFVDRARKSICCPYTGRAWENSHSDLSPLHRFEYSKFLEIPRCSYTPTPEEPHHLFVVGVFYISPSLGIPGYLLSLIWSHLWSGSLVVCWLLFILHRRRPAFTCDRSVHSHWNSLTF